MKVLKVDHIGIAVSSIEEVKEALYRYSWA